MKQGEICKSNPTARLVYKKKQKDCAVRFSRATDSKSVPSYDSITLENLLVTVTGCITIGAQHGSPISTCCLSVGRNNLCTMQHLSQSTPGTNLEIARGHWARFCCIQERVHGARRNPIRAKQMMPGRQSGISILNVFSLLLAAAAAGSSTSRSVLWEVCFLDRIITVITQHSWRWC